MGRYKVEIRKLAIEILGCIMESLNLGANYLKENFEQGLQMLVANNYPPPFTDSSKNITIGAPIHTDHSIITLLLQTSPGLQVMDKTTADNNSWKLVPFLQGSFQVLVGDHLEVLSNGRYVSVIHRVVLESNRNQRRISIANLQSLRMDEILETADELVDDKHPKLYKGSSVRDYLKNLISKDSKPFLNTLQIVP